MAAEMINEPRMQNMLSVDKCKIKNSKIAAVNKSQSVSSEIQNDRAEPKHVTVQRLRSLCSYVRQVRNNETEAHKSVHCK